MSTSKLHMAYLLGCKMASIDNANELSKRMVSNQKSISRYNPTEEFNKMQNGEEKAQTESSAPFGEKHQLAINPEWTGP